MTWTQQEWQDAASSFNNGDAKGLLKAISSYVDRSCAAAAAVSHLRYIETAYVIRPLNTDFVISAERDATVSYTVECYVPVTLLANNAAADVVLKVGGVIVSNPGEEMDVTLALGLSIRPTHRKTFSARVPAGSTVNLTSVIVGAGTATYLYGQETLL